ncbi:hypothetical protein KASHIRA_01820 [Serratia phage vB_SmaM-Kashira]|nr:hypothetical protein [Acinetobacter phage ABPH49]URC22756.1 hypothetical protein KASHIRA_01820 [Serratia phage vB_SmaM-Kashira]
MSKLDKEINRIPLLVAVELASRAHDEAIKNPDLRYGQALFNLVTSYHPNLATFYTGTGADFFYEQSSVAVNSMFYKYWVSEE